MLSINLQGLDAAVAKLNSIKPAAVRRRIVVKAARQLLKSAKARVAAQTDLSGQPFAPHAKARRRKMLARLVRRMAVFTAGDNAAVIGWSNSVEGMIAARQQLGFQQTFKKGDFKDRKRLSTKDPATRQQAKALLEAGYKIKRNSGALKSPTIKWIVSNLNMGKAGLILRILKGSKEQWTTKLPARSFLGVTDDDLKTLSETLTAEISAALNGAVA